MKIPTSSSIVLATLAISSSSASLAAPTGDATTGHGSSLQNARQVTETEEMADSGMTEIETGEQLEARDLPLLSGIIGSIPVVGPLITPLLAAQCGDPNNPNSQANHDPAAVQRLQDAINTVSSVLSGVMPTGVPLPGLPIALPSGLPIPGGLPLLGAKGVDPEAPGDPNSPQNSTSSVPPASDPMSTAWPSASSDMPQPAAAGETTTTNSTEATNTSDGSFLISPTTTIANAQDASSTADPDYLSATPTAGSTSSGGPSGPPNTPVPVETSPPSE